jgi:hypothetical protein
MVSSLEIFRPKLYMHFSPLLCVLYVPFTTSSLVWTHWYLVKNINYETPRCALYTIILLLSVTSIKISPQNFVLRHHKSVTSIQMPGMVCFRYSSRSSVSEEHLMGPFMSVSQYVTYFLGIRQPVWPRVIVGHIVTTMVTEVILSS